MDKIKRIEKYLFDFFSSRFENFDLFFRSTHQARQIEIYKLKDGNELMNFIMGIHGYIEEKLYFKNLIPQIFVTPEALLTSLESFKKYLNENQKYIDKNIDDENTLYLVTEINRFKYELVQMIDYAKKIYDYEDTTIPYQELRYNLITNNISNFITILKSILASVSYQINKTQEGFYHANIHLILKLLGFEIISEESTNNGRIDAVIRFSDSIYIVEFKFHEKNDLSNEALQQIKDKEYALKFKIENKDIYGIGISFSEILKNINGFIFEKLE